MTPAPHTNTLFIVPCSATKSRILSTQPMPAKEAYTGQAFRLCRSMVEAARVKWCILSAHYGFIWPTTVIEYYDVKMTPVDEHTCWDECFGSIKAFMFFYLKELLHFRYGLGPLEVDAKKAEENI